MLQTRQQLTDGGGDVSHRCTTARAAASGGARLRQKRGEHGHRINSGLRWQCGVTMADKTIERVNSTATAGPGVLVDGRQSGRARDIARGATRALSARGFCSIPEVTLASGRRADLLALGEDGAIWIIEIKSSVEDFRADHKWADYRPWCDRLLFAVMPDFPVGLLPDDAGFMLADRFGGEIAREAPEHRLAAARRKAVMQRLARVAAGRLMSLADPEAVCEPRPW